MLSEDMLVLQQSESMLKDRLAAISDGRRFYELDQSENIAQSVLYGALRYIERLMKAHVRGTR